MSGLPNLVKMFWVVCNYNEETNCPFDSEMNLPKRTFENVWRRGSTSRRHNTHGLMLDCLEVLPFEVKDYEMFTYISSRTGWESYEKLYFLRK